MTAKKEKKTENTGVMTKEQAQKTLEEAGIKGIDWSTTFTVERFLAWVVLSIEFWSNPPKTLKADHDPASTCLCEAMCCNLQALQIMANHMNEHHPEPTPEG